MLKLESLFSVGILLGVYVWVHEYTMLEDEPLKRKGEGEKEREENRKKRKKTESIMP